MNLLKQAYEVADKITDMTDCFIEKMRHKHPEEVEDFLEDIDAEFEFFLDYETAKKVVDNLKNESTEHPKGEKWAKETTLRTFRDMGKPTSSDKYSENGVYFAMNMVYSDFFPMYGDDVRKYVEHAYLFLKDKDYNGRYSKEKWYALKK